MNFLIIYFVLLIMFSITFNLNFVFLCEEYASLFSSFVVLMDSSMGNYDFTIFD